MKLVLRALLLIFISFYSFSQAPQGFNYQAIVRDASGNVRANEGVQFEIQIQDVSGNAVYSESHTVLTNEYGLADDIIIGKGSTNDNFSTIHCANGACLTF